MEYKNCYDKQYKHEEGSLIQRNFLGSNTSIWIAGILVACIAFAVYLPAVQNSFVNWDDDAYVYKNENIQSIDYGLLKWSFTTRVLGLWHPLSFLSFAIDYAVWGLNPIGYHLINIVLHTLNTVLVYILSIMLIMYGKDGFHRKAIIVSFITSLLFGIHPLRVESVAWVSERKDILCAFFFLLSLYFYLKYVFTGLRRFNYAMCLIFFILAMLSKPMAISLPIVFLILDYYPLKRLTIEGNAKVVILEKLIFFFIGVLPALITLVPQFSGNVENIIPRPFTERLLLLLHGYVFYLHKMMLPVNLAPLYPYPPKVNFLAYEYLGSFILLSLIFFFCISTLRRKKVFFCVWLYYIVTVFPVIGAIGVSPHSMADRYTYLPSLGPFMLFGLAIETLVDRSSKRQQKVVIAALILLSVILVNKTESQIAIWKDSLTLWSYEMKLFPSTAFRVYNNRGEAYIDLGKYREAINEYNLAIKLNSQDAEVFYNRGIAYSKSGNYEAAITDFTKVIELTPQFSLAYNNRGNALNMTGRHEEALKDFNTAIELNPQLGEAYYNLGLAYFKFGNTIQAEVYLKKAASLGIRQAKYLLNK